MTDFLVPKTCKQLLQLRAKHEDFVILAGGTDLCVQINSGLLKPKGIISMSHIDDLKEIKADDEGIHIGAMATHTDAVNSPLVNKYLPALGMACRQVGAVQIQNRGTIGGNVMNASPAGDTLPVLLAYDAVVELASVDGKRKIAFKDFYVGYRRTVLKPSEVVIGFTIQKRKKKDVSSFQKIGTRKAQAISKVMVCTAYKLEKGIIKDARVALGSVAAIPIRLNSVEVLLEGNKLNAELIQQAAELTRNEVKPIDDIRSTADYRRHVAGVLVSRCLRACFSPRKYFV